MGARKGRKEEEFQKLKEEIHGAEKLIADFVNSRCDALKADEERKKARKNDTEADQLRNQLEDAHEAAAKSRALKNAPVIKKDIDTAEEKSRE